MFVDLFLGLREAKVPVSKLRRAAIGKGEEDVNQPPRGLAPLAANANNSSSAADSTGGGGRSGAASPGTSHVASASARLGTGARSSDATTGIASAGTARAPLVRISTPGDNEQWRNVNRRSPFFQVYWRKKGAKASDSGKSGRSGRYSTR